MLFACVLAVALAPPPPASLPVLPPPRVPETVAVIMTKETLKDGNLIRASVKFLKPGTYFVVGGYVVATLV